MGLVGAFPKSRYNFLVMEWVFPGNNKGATCLWRCTFIALSSVKESIIFLNKESNDSCLRLKAHRTPGA